MRSTFVCFHVFIARQFFKFSIQGALASSQRESHAIPLPLPLLRAPHHIKYIVRVRGSEAARLNFLRGTLRRSFSLQHFKEVSGSVQHKTQPPARACTCIAASRSVGARPAWYGEGSAANAPRHAPPSPLLSLTHTYTHTHDLAPSAQKRLASRLYAIVSITELAKI